MKRVGSHIAWVLALAFLLVAGCASTGYNQQQRTGHNQQQAGQEQAGMMRSPEYYRLYGPGAMQPPDYGYPGF